MSNPHGHGEIQLFEKKISKKIAVMGGDDEKLKNLANRENNR